MVANEPRMYFISNGGQTGVSYGTALLVRNGVIAASVRKQSGYALRVEDTVQAISFKVGNLCFQKLTKGQIHKRD